MIKIHNGIETGKLKDKIQSQPIPLSNDTIIISTVDNEWSLQGKYPKKQRIFLDVQGYIRSAQKDSRI